MITLRALLLLVALLSCAGIATAQEDPSVNESDFDTHAPAPDESYLNETGGSSDPALNESDFDTNVPSPDEAYLSEGSGGSENGVEGERGGADVPTLGLLAALATLGSAAALRRP